MRGSLLSGVCCLLLLLLPLSTSSPLKRQVSSRPVVRPIDEKIPPFDSERVKQICYENARFAGCVQQNLMIRGGEFVNPFQTCIAGAKANSTNLSGNCTLKSKAKKIARERYCRLFNESHISLTDLEDQIRDVKVNCRLQVKGRHYKSLNDIIAEVKKWRDNVRKELRCCGGKPVLDVRNRTQRFGKDFVEFAKFPELRSIACNGVMGIILKDIYKTMKLVENLQTLGRRPGRCLRGCAAMDHVECSVKHAK